MLTDYELLTAFVRKRSQDAFRELVDRHLKLVYAAALRQVRDPGLAEDIAQSVFLVLAQKAPLLCRRGTVLSAWLLTVTRYGVGNAIKRRAARRHHEQKAAVMRNTTDSSIVDSEALGSVIDDALNDLSPGDRDAVSLYYLENMSLRDIGRALDISDDAAQKRVSRAMSRLKTVLSHRGIRSSSDALKASMHDLNAIVLPAVLPAKIFAGALGQSVASGSALAVAEHIFKRLLVKKIASLTATAVIYASVVTGIVILVSQLFFHPHPANQAMVAAAPQMSPVATNYDVSNVSVPVPPAKADYAVLQQNAVKGDSQSLARLQTFANGGDPEAQYYLGNYYFADGQYDEAFNYYQKAADGGDPHVEVMLGDFYSQGLGMKQDYVQAFNWYQKAAVQGDRDACLNLSRMYQLGLGVTQDARQAEYWAQKAQQLAKQ